MLTIFYDVSDLLAELVPSGGVDPETLVELVDYVFRAFCDLC